MDTMVSVVAFRSLLLAFSDPFIIEVTIEIENCMSPILDSNGPWHCDQSLADHIGDVRKSSRKSRKGLESD